MPGNLLTTQTTIQCPHGGSVILFTSNSKVFAQSAPVLLESDAHPIAGCPFTIGTKYSPCIRVQWSAGSTRSDIQGTPELVQSSIGQCMNAEGAMQGVALIVNTQPKVTSQ